MALSKFVVNRFEYGKNAQNKADKIFFSLTMYDNSLPDITEENQGSSPNVYKETKGVQYHITGKEFDSLPTATNARRKAIKNIMRREVKAAHTKWMEEIKTRRPKPQRMSGDEINTELGLTGREIKNMKDE